MMVLTYGLLTIIVALILVYIWNLKSCYDYFKQRGLPGPLPTFFFGHYRILWSLPNLSEQYRRWTQQYGSIYGLFEGTRPMYVVSDVEFLHEVYINQFALFNERSVPFLMKTVRGHQVHMFGASGSTWRRQRHVINPTFSAAKLKLMSSAIYRCIQSLVNKLEVIQEKREQFNIYELYRRLTMDVICHCAFGMDTDMQNDIDNAFLQKCKLAVHDNPERLPLTKLGNLMPFLIPVLLYIMMGQMLLGKLFRIILPKRFSPEIEGVPALWILNQVETIINARKQASDNGKQHQIDLLQLMLDATMRNKAKSNSIEHSASNNTLLDSKTLYREEVGANILLFMIAGYDSISTALASCTYVLATNSNVQRKLQAEVDEQEWNEDGQLSYDVVTNMNYMDMFIREVLRMYPIATTATKRECNTTTTICGHEIQKGALIQPDILSIHYDHNLWGPEDPYEFVPERHYAKRHLMAYMSFGAGPRGCLGIRFAFMELKMALSQLLRRYTVLPGEDIEKGFQHRETFLIQPDAVYIRLERR
ncbi:unnamed protein product [Adineta ricciae]|uniref:Cytochrome P450 n=1 Tax=Adineta ricciae TaxID=249248 RepID=A0A814QWW1_ADIRI|nr:unnamed protein product [Adineta ricciae]CAF1309074.1 unnamed protein product [Adineta ricciae]